jgi:RHS repeat-associated protein
MKNYIHNFFFCCCLLLALPAIGQQYELVGDKKVPKYANTSYKTIGAVTLEPGFCFPPCDGTTTTETAFFVSVFSNTASTSVNGKKGIVTTEILTEKGYTSDALVNSAAHPVRKTFITYIDGLGRPIQDIAQKQSADQDASAGNDVVQFYAYDNLGRQTKSFLPYVASNGDGLFKSTALQDQATWYQNHFGDSYAYVQSVFENSPLQRIKEQGAPGAAWQPTTGSSIKRTLQSTLRTNNANDVVYQFTFDQEESLVISQYSTGTLNVGQVTDEEGNKSLNFTNISGQVVLKRTQLDEDVKLEGYTSSINTPWLDTYYVYDDFGSLKFMIPPKAVELLKQGKTWAAEEVQRLIYTYKYDTRGRLVEKQVPGSGPVYLKYDKLDRLVLMQDANLRSKNSNSWYYKKYDRAHRTVIEGIYTFDAATEGYTSVDLVLQNQSSFYEERNASSADHFYTNQAFPTASASTVPIVINYFDTYYNYTTAVYTPDLLAGQEGSAYADPHHMQTGKKTRVLNSDGITNTWLQEVYFYDSNDRLIQKRSNNHLRSSALDDVATNVYNFEGKVVSSQSVVDISNKYKALTTSDGETLIEKIPNILTVENKIKYDANSGLVKEVRQRNKLNSNAWDKEGFQLVAQYTYNGLGDLVDKKLHEKAVNSNTYLQSIDYSYNIRGWLTKINDINNSTEGDLFRMQLLYQTSEAELGNTIRYDGKISAIKWQVSSDGTSAGTGKLRSYKFSYDKIGRLKEANYSAWAGSGWSDEVGGYDEKGISYDHNGNIISLKRNMISNGTDGNSAGSIIAIDNLAYTLAGNRLMQVEDAATAEGFRNGVNSTTEMAYAAGGNLINDANKGMVIEYNHLNKISKISYTDGSGKSISYGYDASGNRLSATTVSSTGATPVIHNYVGGVVAEGYTFAYFGMTEGRVRISGSSFIYEYFVKDHQGNVRLSFEPGTDANGNMTAHLVQENHYYPFGMVMQGTISGVTPTKPNRRLFNGESEWQNQFSNDPNYHSTFFREYDPVLGRFNGIDPLAEQFTSWSPYHYSYNDPISFNDPTGASANPYGKGYRGVSFDDYRPRQDYDPRPYYGGDPMPHDRTYVSASNFGAMLGLIKSGNISLSRNYIEIKYFSQASFINKEGILEKGPLFYMSTDRVVLNSSLVQNGGSEIISRLTLWDANSHYRNGGGTDLTVDASKIDLSFVDPNIFSSVGDREVVSTLFNSRDGLVYGQLELIYRGNNKVEIVSNDYDFDVGASEGHPWVWGNYGRNSATLLGNILAGPGQPYTIHFSGLGDLNYRPAPFVPKLPNGYKY